MNIEQRSFGITLDTKRGSRVPLIDLNTGDVNSVIFKINITKNGQEQKVPDNSIVLIYFQKEDETKVVQSTVDGSVVVLDGEVVCRVMSNSIGISGTTQVEIKVKTPEDKMLITPVHFRFKVRESIVCDEDIKSTNEYPLLIDLINQVEDSKQKENTFGKSDKFTIKHDRNKYVYPVGSIYYDGYDINDFGARGFGGSDLVSINLQTRHTDRNSCEIQPSDLFEKLEFDKVELISDTEYVVFYKNVKQGLYLRLL